MFLCHENDCILGNNLLLYSTNSYLSYYINETFYGGTHFVWCTPVLNPQILDHLNPLRNIPVSSSPFHIYNRFTEDVKTGDKHSGKIENNRINILKGATIMLGKKIITNKDFALIKQTVELAELEKFRPLLYLIPRSSMAVGRIKEVPVDLAANPLGNEYQIHDLKTGEFDAVTLT